MKTATFTSFPALTGKSTKNSREKTASLDNFRKKSKEIPQNLAFGYKNALYMKYIKSDFSAQKYLNFRKQKNLEYLEFLVFASYPLSLQKPTIQKVTISTSPFACTLCSHSILFQEVLLRL